MRLATIDVGTNTTLLLVVDARGADDIQVLADRAEITRLGRGIGGTGDGAGAAGSLGALAPAGRLGGQGIEQTLAALTEYAGIARAHQAEVVAVGTEALRRAPNAGEFLQAAAAVLGAPLEVIDGDREAALSYRAAASSFPAAAAGSMVVVDIGGGSTEVIRSEAGEIRFRRSLPLGSVRLTEKHVRSDPPADGEVAAIRAEVRAALAGAPLGTAGDPPPALVGIAGTVTSLAAMDQRLTSYDPALVHGYRLTPAALETLVDTLRHATAAERGRMPGLDPRRADVILAGACILADIVAATRVPHVIVSDRGIRWGLVYERLGP
jgi:exopolyphosphatase/guanosine-5'-triphosphate,3'-diphosphate pyrophosphatase